MMLHAIKEKIHGFLNKGEERSVLVKKNIGASFLIKGMTILISLILIPLTINYVNPERNGIWLTLYSMVFWLILFDVGLGAGVKNKLTEAKAAGDVVLARQYISTAYATMLIICSSVFILFYFTSLYVDWSKIMNIPQTYKDEVDKLIWITIASFCFTYILNLLKTIVAADQRPAVGSFVDMLGQLLILVGVFILSKTVPPSLISLGLVSGFSPVVVLSVASLLLFNTRYKDWKPGFKYVNFNLVGNVMKLGIKFFIVYCAALIVTQTLPFLIQRLTNPIEVTNYNTAFRLFAMALNAMYIVTVPFWTSFTDAYAKNDFIWMKKSAIHLRKIFIYFLVFQLIILFLSPLIFHLWVNYWVRDTLHISFFMSTAVCVYVSALCWTNINIYPLNGIGKVKLQVYCSVAEMLALIPLALWLGKLWGAPGIVLAPVITFIPRMIWAPVQLNKLVNQTDKGIWNK
ncbi:MAG: MATE family efflux transporter [Bacteroidales bacterium]|jgi:O-antigen/teichoic acid export membrane protein|nr:MATE family efflux transporter [Bacteroidales bacterium]